jgi:hypothetical protein
MEFIYFTGGLHMEKGHFYYINDQYFIDFTDSYLMKNKETINGQVHDRPCFYAFEDTNTGLFWMIPFSSQVSKYRNYYNQKVAKYKKCDTITFGYVLGYEKAFLIQNMCPITAAYIKNEYLDKATNTPVRISGDFEQELVTKAKRVLALQRKGIKLVFPNVLSIEAKLLEKK